MDLLVIFIAACIIEINNVANNVADLYWSFDAHDACIYIYKCGEGIIFPSC